MLKDMSKENIESCFAISNSHSFIVAPEKYDEFLKESEKNKGKGRKLLEERLKKHDKGNLTWEI